MAQSGTGSRSSRGLRARAGAEANGPGRPVQLAEIQRARILAAMFDVAAEQGAAHVSVAHVVERSGVSRRTFYEAFSDREDCFLAAFEEALALASRRVLPAYEGDTRWREQVRAGLVALLCFLDEEPAVGRLLIVESLTGGARTLERRGQVLVRVAAAIDEGRGESANAASLPSLTAEGLVGGALSLIHARIVRSDREPPPMAGDTLKGIPNGHTASRLLVLANQLMSMIVLPYLGAAAARRELERPLPAPVPTKGSSRGEGLLSDPFKDAGMRLTYRTVRVLLAVAEHSGASNRLIGETAGISDQGQMSKLLGRLRRLGLISNTGLGPGQGAPNAWTLTEKGRRIAQSIHTHTAGESRAGGER